MTCTRLNGRQQNPDPLIPEQCLNQRVVSLSPLCVHFKFNFLNWVLHLHESLVLKPYFGWIIIIIMMMMMIYNIYKTLYSLCSGSTCFLSFWILWAEQRRCYYQQDHPVDTAYHKTSSSWVAGSTTSAFSSKKHSTKYFDYCRKKYSIKTQG